MFDCSNDSEPAARYEHSKIKDRTPPCGLFCTSVVDLLDGKTTVPEETDSASASERRQESRPGLAKLPVMEMASGTP